MSGRAEVGEPRRGRYGFWSTGSECGGLLENLHGARHRRLEPRQGEGAGGDSRERRGCKAACRHQGEDAEQEGVE